MREDHNTARGYAGAEWVKAAQRQEISPFGERVADLLGDLFLGIYHIADDVRRADWTTRDWIDMTICGQNWATWDGSLLTRLVLLAHDDCIRVEIEACAPRVLRVRFYPRTRDGNTYQRHPTMEDAIARHRSS